MRLRRAILLLVFLIVAAQSCTALLNVSLDRTSCAGMRREVTRHASRVAHHLLLDDIGLALQRLAVAVDAVQLGLPRVSAAQRTQKSGCSFRKERCSAARGMRADEAPPAAQRTPCRWQPAPTSRCPSRSAPCRAAASALAARVKTGIPLGLLQAARCLLA